jgi:hypothetical protein
MFEMSGHTPPADKDGEGKVTFAYQNGHVKGGWQGGRGWDKQSPHLNASKEPGYIVAGGWMVDNVKEALDAPNEVRSPCEVRVVVGSWFARAARKVSSCDLAAPCLAPVAFRFCSGSF